MKKKSKSSKDKNMTVISKSSGVANQCKARITACTFPGTCFWPCWNWTNGISASV